MTFRRITEMEEPDLIPAPEPASHSIGPRALLHKTSKRKHHVLDEELIPFRKVRIRSWVPPMLAIPITRYKPKTPAYNIGEKVTRNDQYDANRQPIYRHYFIASRKYSKNRKEVVY